LLEIQQERAAALRCSSMQKQPKYLDYTVQNARSVASHLSYRDSGGQKVYVGQYANKPTMQLQLQSW